MSAEYLGDSVKFKMRSQTVKKQSREKLYQYILLIVLIVFVVFSIALIACLCVINSQIREILDKTKSLKGENDFKSDIRRLVNKHVGTVGLDIRDMTTDYVLGNIQENIYTNIEYGQFFKFDKSASFLSAKYLCREIGGFLIEFNETYPNTEDFLLTLKREFSTTSFWIGLTAKDNDGQFKWMKAGTNYSRTPQAMSLWSNREPTDVDSKPCVVIDHLNSSKEKVTITNVHCDEEWGDGYQSHVICQKLK